MALLSLAKRPLRSPILRLAFRTIPPQRSIHKVLPRREVRDIEVAGLQKEGLSGRVVVRGGIAVGGGVEGSVVMGVGGARDIVQVV